MSGVAMKIDVAEPKQGWYVVFEVWLMKTRHRWQLVYSPTTSFKALSGVLPTPWLRRSSTRWLALTF
jgi:hypothetical protein